MIEPVAPEDFQRVFATAAATVLGGAGYAGLFAWARLKNRRLWLVGAYMCYAASAAAMLLLTRAAHLNGAWQGVVVLMLVGYLLAPHGIWHLCVASHRLERNSRAPPGD
ncbi:MULTISPECIES: hypothetical protein [Methylococcus]|mgnify:CR=1 FL=1|uniref:Uncharacterized protein n=1 Tax=Methylococcus capsulatus TaxID=414 RepID=A0AA35UR47_METCP|nr:hypothetical protein [Methylococcus capsulatus]QXP87021.1 hypothetical protein KW112_11620 [Methylococcus capsulatus]QXP91631.1 hypothetical protein KW114_05670 [Methylococcus capsulatus]QXP93299.1 hypothetical protein KW113_13225 [Methylococcus capsulatus]UQN12005.1 hypothetical protein M3M30_13375 [Methylococcus capsulatus]CAI8833605.1 membrane protein of unknown function [Methylococcus capsulatus]